MIVRFDQDRLILVKRSSALAQKIVCFRPSGSSTFDWSLWTVYFDSRPSTLDLISTGFVSTV